MCSATKYNIDDELYGITGDNLIKRFKVDEIVVFHNSNQKDDVLYVDASNRISYKQRDVYLTEEDAQEAIKKFKQFKS